MTEQQQPEGEIVQEAPSPKRSSVFRRVGCLVMLIVWFVVLLLPCFFIILATQNEIIISQGSLPNQEIRILLIMDEDKRGIFVSSTSLHLSSVDQEMCLQTDVNYFLWQGSAESVTYCECYQQVEENYTPAETYAGSCSAE